MSIWNAEYTTKGTIDKNKGNSQRNKGVICLMIGNFFRVKYVQIQNTDIQVKISQENSVDSDFKQLKK